MSRLSTDGRVAATGDQPEDKWLSLISSASSARAEPVSYSVWLLGSAAEGTLPEPVGKYGLTYKYLELLSEDKEEVASRLHFWNLCQSGLEWKQALSSLACDAVVLLLDWQAPSTFARQLHDWMQLIQQVINPDQAKQEGIERRIRGGSDTDNVLLPLQPGEFDSPLPVRVVVLLQDAGYMDVLQRERGWNEELFDYTQQFIRTVALKYGASVFYTHTDTDIQPLLCQTLGIERPSLAPQIVERQKVCVPAGWDSWKKIILLRDKFDVEQISTGWTSDPKSIIELYESTIRGPSLPTFPMTDTVVAMPMQEFLRAQAEVLASLEPPPEPKRHPQLDRLTGPVDVNVGGIRVDAEDLNKRLTQMTREDTPDVEEPTSEQPDKSQNEVLADFFQRLLDKNGPT